MGHASADRSPSDHPARGGHRAVHRRSLRSVPAGPGVGSVSPGYRIWLHVDGVRMFGPGTHELLRHVEDTGSLHQAAKTHGHVVHQGLAPAPRDRGAPRLGRWSSAAWAVATGGGTSLTKRGRDLLQRFEKFMAETDAAMLEAFDAAFGDWSLAPRSREP